MRLQEQPLLASRWTPPKKARDRKRLRLARLANTLCCKAIKMRRKPHRKSRRIRKLLQLPQSSHTTQPRLNRKILVNLVQIWRIPAMRRQGKSFQLLLLLLDGPFHQTTTLTRRKTTMTGTSLHLHQHRTGPRRQ
jgi:hypothetical protein